MKAIYKLLIGDLSKARIIGFLLAQIVGVAIIIVSLQFFFDIKKALDNDSQDNEYVILNKKVGTLSGLLSSDMSFTSSEVEKLKSMEGVLSVGEFLSSNFNVNTGVNISSMGVKFTTEMFFESIDNEYIDVELKDWKFDPNDGFVPIIVPVNYINLYNIGFAPSNGLPKLSKNVIKGVSLDVIVSDRQGSRRQFEGRIVGFSSRISTILAPVEFVEWGNKNYSVKDDSRPSRLILKINPSRSDSIIKSIDKFGYEVENKVFNYEKVSRIISFILAITLIIGIVITVLSIFLLILSLFLLIQRNQEKIFNLFILGFNTRSITRPYITVCLIMNSVSFVVAYLLSLYLRYVYTSIMSDQLGLSDIDGFLVVPFGITIGLYITTILVSNMLIIREIIHIRK